MSWIVSGRPGDALEPSDIGLIVHEPLRSPSVNRLFESLSPQTRARLRPYIHTVHLEKGRTIYDVGTPVAHVFFPVRGMVALLATTEDAEAIEVAMVGADGIIGVPPLWPENTSPYEVVVQASCDAHRLSTEALLHEFKRGDDLQRMMLAYVDGLVRQLVQSAVCQSHHSLAQRLCRWLLSMRDGLGSDTIELTQESIAHMLGLSRPRVSVALTNLEEKQLIRQRHGRLRIVNPRGLEACSCECHRVLRDHTPSHALITSRQPPR
jgi:CRP-like cAMP-binding protein